ncbi:uncharacterized protein LOC131883147 isoform X2 [Tigriopus californicus]|uniref:uncharacterized protein LOC131883147 isoform X2 n=1 Tax=Tigriopus californicus TaxID=6832 RepID=UPI0027DA2418|nr:uncharacterized protein LOC131883147 isoform X2 [Tigriopus californicus]
MAKLPREMIRETKSEDKQNRAAASLIVVSNRLPFVLKREEDGTLTRKASAGGLVTAVAPVVVDNHGIWVGWTGLDDFDEETEVIPESSPDDKAPTAGLRPDQAIPLSVNPKLFDEYYNGCCNETYWPLFHSMPDRAVFNRDHWKAYQDVNDIFAQKTLEAVRSVHEKRMAIPDCSRPDPPIVWIHDYHLMLAANAIRDGCNDEGLQVRMGFFLHIPFPSFDIIRIFPWVDEILMGMLGCDLVGFHIGDYCLNFLDCCQRCLGCRTDKNKMFVEHCGRRVMVRALPIGIPYHKFESLSRIAPRVFPSDMKIILGVDRLDYTKGLVARLKSLERMFKKYPKWIGKAIFIQVAVPSRVDVAEYKELKETIDRLVGHINGEFSTPSWSPIRYIFGSVNQDQLVAFYRDANVGLITPLRDGMNLVAKEFVACQSESDPGVLILSPFAGAGGLMQEALQVNPYETDNVADVVDRALEMSLDERKLRMNQLKKREKRMDVDAWVRSFLSGMDSLLVPSVRPNHDENVDRLLGNGPCTNEFEATLGPSVEMSTKLGVIIDFDGTLACLARTPELAIIAPEAKKTLERLSKMSDAHIAIISGRQLDDLIRKVGVEGITYAGCHGLEILHPDGQKFSHTIPQDYLDRLNLLEKELKETVAIHGAWVEHKHLLVAWHFREVDKGKRESLIAHAKAVYAKHNFQVLAVSKRIENLPPSGFDRGDSCFHILRSIFGVDWEERVTVVYAGDSAADEFAITKLKGVAHTFRVTNEDTSAITKTSADYWIAGPDGVLDLLRFLERKLLGRSPQSVSRASSVISVGGLDRDVIEMVVDDAGNQHPTQIRRRTSSHGSMGQRPPRSRAASMGSQGGTTTTSVATLHKRALNKHMHSRYSRDETTSGVSPF